MADTIEFEVQGLDELMANFEKLAGEEYLKEALDKVLRNIAQEVKGFANVKMHRSKDVTKSGRKGSRTYEHAADNIPVKISGKNGYYKADIGWLKSDTSPYFYEKFEEYGTSKHAPHPTFSVCKEKYQDKFKENLRRELLRDIKQIIE